MANEATVSLSLIFSIISMIGVLASVIVSLRRETETTKQKEISIEKHFAQLDVKLDEYLSHMSNIDRSSDRTAEKMDALTQEVAKTNERIGTLFRLHDEHEKRITNLENKEK
jgi:peptidoglycan hydrolase CwlO-like protein